MHFIFLAIRFSCPHWDVSIFHAHTHTRIQFNSQLSARNIYTQQKRQEKNENRKTIILFGRDFAIGCIVHREFDSKTSKPLTFSVSGFSVSIFISRFFFLLGPWNRVNAYARACVCKYREDTYFSIMRRH